jgi:hypothetical protein
MDNNQSEIESDEQTDSPSPDQPENLSNIVWPLLVGIAFLIVIAVIFNIADAPWREKRRLESNCRNRLRELGSAQMSYQGTNYMKYYGSFQALKINGYFGSGNGLDTLIEGYNLGWYVNNYIYPPNFNPVWGDGLEKNKFTIVAYPRIIQPPELRTFGISQDQVLRVYNPENGNPFISRDDTHIQSWDPVL